MSSTFWNVRLSAILAHMRFSVDMRLLLAYIVSMSSQADKTQTVIEAVKKIPGLIRLAVDITETVDGWTVAIPGYAPQAAETAVAALALAQRFAADLQHSSIMTITWDPHTSIGRSVVAVVTQ